MPKLISSGALALHRSIALTALLSLLLAACGDDDDRRRAAQRATRTATQAVATATSTPLATATQTTAATATATTVPTDTAVPTVTNTAVPTVTHTIVPTATATAAATHTATATSSPVPRQPVQILSPSQGIVTLAQAVPVTFRIDESAELASVTATIDGTSLELNRNGAVFDTQAAVAPGERELIIHIDYGDSTDTASVRFEAIALEAPDQCEILNNASCLLPYPSSRFLEPADTPTGFRLSFPAQHMPRQNSRAFPVEPFHRIDGFSPTVPITMHFPGGVDPVQSHAARLRPETRTHDTISLEPDSPTVLIDATTGERVLHFVEPEVRAAREGKPDRETLLMRAAESLKPGHRYLVAMRRLVTHAGTPVVAEPAFAAMRDGRATLIDAIEQRRPAMAGLFDELESHGIERDELVLAFDFVVASDQSLTAEMLKMRDETFAWVAQNQSVQTFAVERVVENECTPGTRIWRRVEGTFQVPLYLSRDPLADPRNPAVFNRDENDMPVASGFTNPPFTFAIPCTILDADNQVYPIILGHGLFGDGRGFVRELAETDQVTDFNYIAGATDWTGLAAPDAGAGGNLPASFVGRVALDQPRAFAALPDRTRQGQLNTLVMARMMKLGMFNLDPAFQRPDGSGVFPGPDTEQFYFGASLGGIMGLMFGALSPDVERVQVNVSGTSFALLLPRSVAFLPFDAAIQLTGVTDPIQRGLLLNLTHELWARGESAAYVTHVTSDPLPGTNVKRVLLTAALYDQLVTNLATELAARTLGLPNIEGSILMNLPGIPDVTGPQPSGLMFYDTAAFDPNNPAHLPFIPPLADLPPALNRCDPHRSQAYTPAAVDQLFEFLRPNGEVLNFCHGLCDAGEPYEVPYNGNRPCNPL